MFNTPKIYEGIYEIYHNKWYEFPLRFVMWIYGINVYIMDDEVSRVKIFKNRKENGQQS